MTRKYDIKRKSLKPAHITRRQLPITAAYAFTDYRAQGQTIKKVIVDIARPPSGKLTPFNAYVALSRSSGRETIRLLRDFDDEIFKEPPGDELAAEDIRLLALNHATRSNWNQGIPVWEATDPVGEDAPVYNCQIGDTYVHTSKITIYGSIPGYVLCPSDLYGGQKISGVLADS